MMNNNIIISADCACDLPDDLVQKYSICTIPFYIMINDVRFQERTEIESGMLSDYFGSKDVRISSAPASVDEYRSYFSMLTKDKDASVIHIAVSGRLSNACANALAAAREVENVYVIDSRLFSQGIGLLVMAAGELAMKGESFDTICSEIHKLRNKVNCSFAMKTTCHASANNRINQTASYLMDLFKIKPVIRIKHGELKFDGIYLGNINSYTKKYIKRLLKKEKKVSDEILFITISGCTEEYKQLIYNEATKYISWKKIYIQDVSAANFCNVGPESFGLMFYNK